MNRAETVKKLLALGDLHHNELALIMGGDRSTVDAAVIDLMLSGVVVRPVNSYGSPVLRLAPTVRGPGFGGAHA